MSRPRTQPHASTTRRLTWGDGFGVKCNVTFRAAQWRAIELEAGRRNITMTALIRECVDHVLLEPARGEP